jgi:hypothetical protein
MVLEVSEALGEPANFLDVSWLRCRRWKRAGVVVGVVTCLVYHRMREAEKGDQFPLHRKVSGW